MKQEGIRAVALLALLCAGCAHTVRLDTPPPASRAATRASAQSVAIDTVAVRLGDDPMNVSDELLLLVANRLRRSGLFTSVYEPTVSHEAPSDALRLALDVQQTDHLENPVVGTLKALFVIASVHLLAPALPFRYGYEAELDATFERQGGSAWSYRSHAAGSVSYPMTFSDPRRAGIDTRTAVLDRALELLLDQVARDPSFAAAPAPD